jgi:hypothetical protein
MIDWQPIETAPRDGKDVLIYANAATVPLVRLAWWDWSDAEMGRLIHGDEWTPEWTGWWSNSSSCGSEKIGWEPTHWAVWEGPRA